MLGGLKPRDERDLSESIRMAAAAGMPLIVSGAGSKSRIGRPNGYAMSVTTRRMQGISINEPTELVIGAADHRERQPWVHDTDWRRDDYSDSSHRRLLDWATGGPLPDAMGAHVS